MNLFDEPTLRKLEKLTLVADHVRVGIMKGDRRSRKRGTSIEFADYRNYTKGDDLRQLDWNVYARLGRPFIKLLEEEEDLSVHLLLDSSASMDWPDSMETDENKLHYACKLAGALGHISLASGDQLTVTLLNSSGDLHWGPFRGQQNSLRLLQFLNATPTGGLTEINLAMQQYARRGRRPGLLFLLSDMLSPHGYKDGLNALQSRGYEIGLIHILSPDELDPPVSGDLKLVDIETGQDAEITLDPATVDQYRARLINWRGEIATYCGGRGVHYIPVSTDMPWEKLVMQTLRAKGIIN